MKNENTAELAENARPKSIFSTNPPTYNGCWWLLYATCAHPVAAGGLSCCTATSSIRWKELPGFYAVYGFVGCVSPGAGGQGTAPSWVMRPEDYYDD